MNIAYSSALKSATAALAALGYRATREQFHYRVIQSLSFSIDLDIQIINELDQFRKKRNISTYEQSETVSDYEADRMAELAEIINVKVLGWLHEKHPELL